MTLERRTPEGRQSPSPELSSRRNELPPIMSHLRTADASNDPPSSSTHARHAAPPAAWRSAEVPHSSPLHRGHYDEPHMHGGPYEAASGPTRSLRNDGGPSSGEGRSWLPRGSNAPYHQRDHSASSSVLQPTTSPTGRLSRSASTSGPAPAAMPPAMAPSPVYTGEQHYGSHRQRAYTVQDDAPSSWSDASALPSMHRSSDRVGAVDAPLPTLQSHPLLSEHGEPRTYTLHIRQQPAHGRMFGFRTKDRRPLDPLPIVELVVRDRDGRVDHVAHTSPDLLMQVSLSTEHSGDRELVTSSANPSTALPYSRLLEGKLTSSGHNVKDLDGTRVCLFVFTDLSVRVEATVRLRFSLVRLGGTRWQPGLSSHAGSVVAEIDSDPFVVHSSRTFPGLSESTELAKCLAAQGVAVPIRNQSRPGASALD